MLLQEQIDTLEEKIKQSDSNIIAIQDQLKKEKEKLSKLKRAKKTIEKLANE